MNGKNVRCYSYNYDGSIKLSTHFKVYEFRCKDNTDPIFISMTLVDVLEDIRTYFGKPVIINSGYRSPAKNAMSGGAKYSQHMYGLAADIHIDGVSPTEIAKYAETLMPHSGGIGIYDTFCHIDVRDEKSRWNG